MSPSAPRAHRIWQVYRSEAHYEFLRVLRAPSFAVPTLLFPVVFYLMFAVLMSGRWNGFDKASYLLATFCTFGVVGPALFGFGVGLAIERAQGLLQLKRASPMPVSAYFIGKIVMSLLFALIVLLLLSGVAFAFGGVSMPAARWLLLWATMLAGTLEKWASKPRPGTHGYDPAEPDMRAIFIAHGADFRPGQVLPAFDNVDVYPLLTRLLGIPAAANDGDPNTLQAALRRALTDRHRQHLWLNRRDPMRIFADRAYLDAAIAAMFGDS